MAKVRAELDEELFFRVGHVVASSLALRLEIDLQRRLEQRTVNVSRPELMAELARLQAVHLTLNGRDYR